MQRNVRTLLNITVYFCVRLNGFRKDILLGFDIPFGIMMGRFRFKQGRDLVSFYKIHSDRGVGYTVNYCSKQGIARSSLYRILKSFQERNTTERKVGSGEKALKLTSQRRKRLMKAATE